MGLSKDTNMSPADFSYLATFFYVTFAVFQPVHAYLMQKFPTAKYLAVNVILWGIMLAGESIPPGEGTLSNADTLPQSTQLLPQLRRAHCRASAVGRFRGIQCSVSDSDHGHVVQGAWAGPSGLSWRAVSKLTRASPA
jgi:hypothetical protein